MSQKLSDNILADLPKVLDDKMGVFDGSPPKWRPYNNVAEYQARFPNIGSAETQMFWVRNVADANKADLYSLRKDKIPYKLLEDVDLSNYYTKSETDAKILDETNARIASDILKADITYVNNQISQLQPRQDNTLQTANKTIVGAINELLQGNSEPFTDIVIFDYNGTNRTHTLSFTPKTLNGGTFMNGNVLDPYLDFIFVGDTIVLSENALPTIFDPENIIPVKLIINYNY